MTFCGHSQIFGEDDLKSRIVDILNKEVVDNRVDFYLGGYGNFDKIAEMECLDFKIINKSSKLYFVTPYIDENYLKSRKERFKVYDDIIYPSLENIPKKFEIVHRNYWLVNNCDLVISFVDYS